MRLKVILLSMPVAVLALLVASFFQARRSVNPDLNQLVWGSIGDPSYLNPVLSQDGASSDINGLVFNGLLKYDRNLILTGDLAESWEVSGGKKPVITFHLRRGVRWHDGAEFTAADVVFTYEKIMDPGTNTVRRSDYELVESLEVFDPYTVRVRYKEPFSPGLESWGIGIIPKHILEGEDINTAPFNRSPVGTGPFRFKEWVSDEKVVVEAYDDYFEGRPLLDRIVYRVIPETALMEQEQLTGGVDLRGVFPHQYERMTGDEQFDIYKRYGRGYTYIGYNMEKEIFKDRRVRQALTHAINREEIVDYVLYGLGVTASGPFPNHLWYHNRDVKPYPYDPDRARKLLAEAGWRDTDGDGILDRDGKPFEFTLITNSGDGVRSDVGVIVQRQLEEIGVDVKFELYEWSSFLENYVNPRKFDACVLGWGLGVDPDQYTMWHSSQVKDGFNFVSYSNPEVDRLLVEGRREYDQEKRKQIYFRVHELIAEDQPYTFLYVAEGVLALARRFALMKMSDTGKQEPEPIIMEKKGIMVDLIRWAVQPGRPAFRP